MPQSTDNVIIGFDFSINKPAACIYNGKDYKFITWPYHLQKSTVCTLKSSGIDIMDRSDVKDVGKNASDRMRFEVSDSVYLADLITSSIESYLGDNTLIGFEGLSYGSSGNVMLQLSGYKYMLMDRLSRLVPLSNMYTYSPITIKSVAGAAVKGGGKAAVIESFLANAVGIQLREQMISKKDLFLKKGGKSWIDHIDDIVDSYFVVKTLIDKEMNATVRASK